jgi:hypothetical protein
VRSARRNASRPLPQPQARRSPPAPRASDLGRRRAAPRARERAPGDGGGARAGRANRRRGRAASRRPSRHPSPRRRARAQRRTHRRRMGLVLEHVVGRRNDPHRRESGEPPRTPRTAQQRPPRSLLVTDAEAQARAARAALAPPRARRGTRPPTHRGGARL